MNTGPRSGDELDVRALRYFVAVAEELHFTRAAQRLFIAQQALSREIRRLESRLRIPLFVRTTRRVILTPEGQRLHARARELLALHDRIVDELVSPARPVLVDLMSEGRLTPVRVLEAARLGLPNVEYRSRHGGGMGLSIHLLRSAELDVAFGRATWLGQSPTDGLEREVFRYEPMAALLPAGHHLAEGEAVPLSALAGLEVDANPATPEALEWTDLMSQLLALAGAKPAPPHLPAVSREDQAHHLIRQGLPIITSLDHADVPGGVIRPIVEPVPIYPWSIVWRAGAPGRATDAIRTAARSLAAANRWLDLPPGAWLPDPDAGAAHAPPSAVTTGPAPERGRSRASGPHRRGTTHQQARGR